MTTVFVATEEWSNEGGRVLGVFTTRELARALCERKAAEAHVTRFQWREQPGGEEYTSNEGATYWQIVPFGLDEPDE